MNYEAVYRTAPATPGLLKSVNRTKQIMDRLNCPGDCDYNLLVFSQIPSITSFHFTAPSGSAALIGGCRNMQKYSKIFTSPKLLAKLSAELIDWHSFRSRETPSIQLHSQIDG